MEGPRPPSQSTLANVTNNITLSLKRKKYLLYLMDPSENDLQLHWRKPEIPSKNDMFRLHTMPRITDRNTLGGGSSKDKAVYRGLNGIFQDLSTELIHNGNEEDIFIRIYNSEIESQDKPWSWKEFTSVRMEVSFMKPNEKDLFHLPGVHAKSPCGMVHCPCRQISLCAMTRLCPYSELRPAFEFKEHFGRQYYCIRMMVSMTFFKNEEPSMDTQFQRICSVSRERLGQKILNENLYSDFTLKIGKNTFPCHRSVLAGQSEVFAAMFESNMTEAKNHELVMEDMSVESVEAFLKYMYHGDIEDVFLDPEIALELLMAGNKYGIKYLEVICKEILLSFDNNKFNAVNTLHMFAFCGKLDGLSGLENKAIKIIRQNAKKFTSSEEFTNILETDFTLALQLMKRLAS